MELITKPIHYTEEGKKVYDQFYLDEDYLIPDARDDVKRIVQGSAQVRTEDVRMVENYVRVSGKVYVQILYMTASLESAPEVLELKLPFEEMIYVESSPGESWYIRNVRTELTASVVNARKLSLRVMVEMELGRENMKEEEITTDMESDIPICCRKQKIRMLRLSVSKRDTYRIKEEFALPGTKESVGQILMKDVDSRKLEIRAGQDELLIRGELLVFCLYLSAEGKTDWIEQSVPYEGRISCEGITPEMYYNILHSLEDVLVDIRLDEDGEARVIGTEATLALRMSIYEEEETELLSDLYSTDQECTFETKEAVCEELLMQNQSKCKLTERLSLPELKEDVLQVIHSSGTVQTESVTNVEEGVRAEGILHVSFLYLKADDGEPFGSWQGMIPFSHVIECPQMPQDALCSLAYHVEQLLVTLAGSEAVEIKAVLTFDAFLRKPVPITCITSVQCKPFDAEQLDQEPGIVGHIVQPGEDLWTLAKKYKTTENVIRDVNHLSSENVKTGDKLLIFKANMSILEA